MSDFNKNKRTRENEEQDLPNSKKQNDVSPSDSSSSNSSNSSMSVQPGGSPSVLANSQMTDIQILDMTFEQVCDNEELLERWGELRANNTVFINGKIDKTTGKAPDQVVQEILDFIKVTNGAENFVVKESIKVDSSEDNIASEISMEIIGAEIASQFMLVYTPGYIEWNKNKPTAPEVARNSIPIFGPIAKDRYNREDVIQSLTGILKENLTNKIPHISFREHVTTIFCSDVQTALKITCLNWFRINSCAVKYTLQRTQRQEIPTVIIKGFTNPPESKVLKGIINMKFHNLIGSTINFIEIPRDRTGKYQGFASIFVEKDQDPETIIDAINGKSLLGKKVSATLGKKFNQ